LGGARIALCHEWLTTFGGSEVVAGHIASTLGIEDVYSFTVNEALASELFPARRVRTVPGLGGIKFAQRHWQWLLGAMPSAWRDLDLSDYDVVITSSHACVNSIRTRPDAIHISYCHTPMRYAWDWRSEIGRFPGFVRPLWPRVAARLRAQDRARASNVTKFIANSRNVAARIERNYGRTAEVVYPPTDTDYWCPDPSVEKEDFFLLAGRLVPYKRPEIAVQAAELAGVPLVIAGSGPMLEQVRATSGDNVRVVEAPTRSELRDLYRRAKALVFPGEEDFGMTMVEAQACGTPVLALGRGGALEAVKHDATGHLCGGGSASEFAGAMTIFESAAYGSDLMRVHAEGFSIQRFDRAIKHIVDASLSFSHAISS
jgi:glycosyltransferase involved in cell wall biosynthesis